MLKIYGCPRTRSLRALWALEEAGAEYEYIEIDLKRGDGSRPEYLAINPGGKVPVLVDGDLTLTESAAIVGYIGGKFPDSGLAPTGIRERAVQCQWLAFAISELEQPLWTLAKHRFVLPEPLRLPTIAPAAQWEFAKAARVLGQKLQDSPYVAGEYFTGADILVGHTLSWARTCRMPLESPVLEDYADRVLARPALATARRKEHG